VFVSIIILVIDFKAFSNSDFGWNGVFIFKDDGGKLIILQKIIELFKMLTKGIQVGKFVTGLNIINSLHIFLY